MPDENIQTRLDQVVTELGKYYGAISRSDFISMLLLSSSNISSEPTAFSIPDPTPARLAAQALLDTTEGGFTTPELIDRINRHVGEATDANDIPGLIKICYEPALLGNRDDGAKVVLRQNTRPYVRKHDNSLVEQGKIKPGEDISQAFSIKNIGGFGGDATRAAARATVSVNETGASTPDSAHVDCSIIQVFANRLAPASRDMGALTLFMNAIPTIEISRAIPFIDMVLIQEGGHFSPGNAPGTSRISSLSLGQFFLGNSRVQEGTTQHTIVGANDAYVASENSRLPEFERTTTEGEGNQVVTAQPIATAGMELFTMPQTLVNADENHVELDAFAASEEAQVRRQSPVIDKFRPLMSLKSLSLTVQGTGGMMSYKSGKISLVLHDRSRLAEISALVRPARLGSTHLLLEYGWSHPDAPAQSGFTTANRDNLFGSLIGALRTKEKYQIVNASFDFDDAGQVNIELQLSMLASRALQRAQIGLGLDNVPVFQEVKHLTDMIQELRNRMSPTTATAIFGEADIIGSLNSPQGAITPLSADAVREIRNLVSMRSRPGTSSDLTALGNALSDLMGSNGRGGRVQSLRTQMTQKIRDRITALAATSDPFIVPGTPGGQYDTTNVTSSDFISLGKIFASFLLEPITASGHFKDVQIIFYNFNDKASYMANRNIATFPIKKADFSTVLTRELDQLVNMPIETFINFMGTYFISDPGAPAYGFNNAYGNIPTDQDGDGQRQLSNAYRENDAALFNMQQQVLSNAYPGSTGELEFKHPSVSVIMESVPVRAGGSPDQTILRMHIIDTQSTAHATVQSFLEAASSQSIGLLNTRAISAQQTLGRTSGASNDSTSSSVDSSSAEADFRQSLADAVSTGLLEPYPVQDSRATPSAAGEDPERYRIRGGFGKLKSFIMRTVPSMRYGESTSGILSARVTSMNDPALTTINIQRQGSSPETPTGAREQGLPLSIAPVECSLETIGCPLWSFGQQIFIDFGTGTTVDAIYGVTGVEHTIEPGVYKSTVKLTPMNSYARYTSLVKNVQDALVAINGLTGGEPIRIPAPAARSGTSSRRGGGGGAGGGRGGSGTGANTGAGRSGRGTPSEALEGVYNRYTSVLAAARTVIEVREIYNNLHILRDQSDPSTAAAAGRPPGPWSPKLEELYNRAQSRLNEFVQASESRQQQQQAADEERRRVASERAARQPSGPALGRGSQTGYRY